MAWVLKTWLEENSGQKISITANTVPSLYESVRFLLLEYRANTVLLIDETVKASRIDDEPRGFTR
jgi:hypothetical protein